MHMCSMHVHSWHSSACPLYEHTRVVTLYSSIPSTALLLWPENQNLSAFSLIVKSEYGGDFAQLCQGSLMCSEFFCQRMNSLLGKNLDRSSLCRRAVL